DPFGPAQATGQQTRTGSKGVPLSPEIRPRAAAGSPGRARGGSMQSRVASLHRILPRPLTAGTIMSVPLLRSTLLSGRGCANESPHDPLLIAPLDRKPNK